MSICDIGEIGLSEFEVLRVEEGRIRNTSCDEAKVVYPPAEIGLFRHDRVCAHNASSKAGLRIVRHKLGSDP